MKEHLGGKIKAVRKKRKLTQADLAEIVGVDPKYISKIETSNGTPSLEVLEKIAVALHIETKDLFDTSNMKSKEELDREILNSLQNLDMQETRAVFSLVCALSSI